MFFNTTIRVNHYLIFIEFSIIVILAFIVFINPNLHKKNFSGNILVRDGLIYQSGESLPFTGKVLDTLKNHLIIEYDVVDGLKQGEFFLCTLEGAFLVYGFFNNNKNVGNWQYYYENGQLECKGNFLDDKPTGKWIWYYENGVKYCEGFFLQGQPEGKWFKYDRDGNLRYIIYYVSGEMINQVAFQGYKVI